MDLTIYKRVLIIVVVVVTVGRRITILHATVTHQKETQGKIFSRVLATLTRSAETGLDI